MYNSKDGWKDNLNSNDEYLASYEEGQVQIQRLRAIEEKEKNARRKQKLEEAEKVLKAREEQVRLVLSALVSFVGRGHCPTELRAGAPGGPGRGADRGSGGSTGSSQRLARGDPRPQSRRHG